MKKIICFIMTVAAVAAMAGCRKTTQGVTGITYYPVMTMYGDDYVLHPKGETYVDEGCSAMLNGEDVTDRIVVSSNVKENVSGVYNVIYSCTNADGFSAALSRTVVVLDMNSDVEGFYEVAEDSYRDYGGTITKFSGYKVLIIENEDGTLSVEDLFGGYYSQRAGYGDAYNMSGIISVSGAAVELEEAYNEGFGDSVDGFDNATYDAVSKTFHWETPYAGLMTFYVTLEKIEL